MIMGCMYSFVVISNTKGRAKNQISETYDPRKFILLKPSTTFYNK